jgi:hypothetical protein
MQHSLVLPVLLMSLITTFITHPFFLRSHRAFVKVGDAHCTGSTTIACLLWSKSFGIWQLLVHWPLDLGLFANFRLRLTRPLLGTVPGLSMLLSSVIVDVIENGGRFYELKNQSAPRLWSLLRAIILQHTETPADKPPPPIGMDK